MMVNVKNYGTVSDTDSHYITGTWYKT